MAPATLDTPPQVIQQEVAAERRPTRWGPLGLLVLIPIVFVVWLAMSAIFGVESRTDQVEDYFHAMEAEPHYQALNTRYQLLEPCVEVADLAYCIVEEQSDLYDRAGLNVQFKATFLFEEDNSLLPWPARSYSFDSNYGNFPPEGWDNPLEFEELYLDWLERSHPDVYHQLDDGWWWDETREALALMAYIDEFLAESDQFPLS